MRAARFGIMLFCSFLVLASVGGATIVEAQNDACSALAKTALDAVKQACGEASPNSVCFGYQAVNVAAGQKQVNIAAGDQFRLAETTSVTTSAADPEAANWGIAMLNIQAGSPEPVITAILFGDATITSNVRADGANLPTLPVKTAGGVPVLLRGGAGPSYPSSLRLAPGQSALVDGRNKAGDWLRVRLESAVGWAYTPQVTVTGDVNALTVLEATNTRADFLYTGPMQAFTLTTGAPSACGGEAPNGLLLQLSGEKTAHLLINGADLAFSEGTLFVRATPRDRLEIAALSGGAMVTAMGSAVTLSAGDWTRVRLGGKDGLTASAAPTVKTKFPFAAVDGAPVAALPGALACTVGLPTSTARIAVRVGPGQERGSLFFMKPDASYKAIGWANDASGAPWWKIDVASAKEAWVQQSAVRSLGACGEIVQAEIPPVIVAPPPVDNSTTDTGGDTTAGDDTSTGATSYVPGGPAIYNVTAGNDRLVGSCQGVAPINYCPSLVQITPTKNGVLFKGQELRPYPMYKVRDNVYAYSGAAPAALGTGTIRLTLVFTSPTTWTVSRVLVLNDAPDCQHHFSFSGSFLR